MKDKLQAIIEKHAHLSEQMTDPNIFNDQEKITAIAKEHKSMEEVVNTGKAYIHILDQIDDDKAILEGDDDELKEIAQEEVLELESEKIELEEKLKVLLLPKNSTQYPTNTRHCTRASLAAVRPHKPQTAGRRNQTTAEKKHAQEP